MDNDQLEKLILDEMTDYFAEQDYPDELREADLFHLRRYVRSISWLQDINIPGSRVLELGGASISTRLLTKFFPGMRIVNSDFELQEQFPYEDESFDLVLNMEVIEHIFDIVSLHETTLSGVKHVLSECHRILDEKGIMFLTTPNASSLYVLKRALLSEPPLFYERHFREFTFTEIVDLVNEAGFYTAKSATERVWHLWDFSDIEHFMREQNYPADNRGDCSFVIAYKSAEELQEQTATMSEEPGTSHQSPADQPPPSGLAGKIRSILKRGPR